MRQQSIYAFLVAVGLLSVLSSCQKQDDEPIPQPECETVNVKFNTFLREGDNVRPFNVGTRATAGEGTLANGFYLYGHAHTQPFATSAGNTYTPIFENVKVNADGTYAIPKFWLQDKSRLYSFQAFAATDEKGAEVGPGTVTVPSSGAPYVTSIPAVTYLHLTDVLGAAVYDVKIGDETPTVNLYFEHRLAKLSLKLQRMNPGGPTLYNLRAKFVDLYATSQVTRLDWTPEGTISDTWRISPRGGESDPITLPAGEMKPVETQSFILLPQTISYDLPRVTMYYTLRSEAVSASNPETSLTTTLPALTLASGKQLNVVIGHIVESDQIVLQSVTLANWGASDKNVPEYGGYAPAGCFDIPIGGSFPNTYVALVDDVAIGWAAAKTNCAKWGGRLPTKDELTAMYDNRLKYGTFSNGWYWSSQAVQYPFVMNMVTGATNGGNVDNPWYVRCVKDK